jgi:hypothetical protein
MAITTEDEEDTLGTWDKRFLLERTKVPSPRPDRDQTFQFQVFFCPPRRILSEMTVFISGLE